MGDLLDNLLQTLEKTVSSAEHGYRDIFLATKAVLLYLNENNTDENCIKVDLFVMLNVADLAKARLKGTNDELLDVIARMGEALHDTHSAPEIAEMFDNTPQQLLAQLNALPDVSNSV